MDAIKKNLDTITNNNVNYIFLSFVIVFLILFSFFTWVFNKLQLQDANYHCKNYKSDNDGNGNSIKFLSADSKLPEDDNTLELNKYIGSATNSSRKDLFRNFHYLTAYNCCSGRNYKNDWVNICALTKALDIGARCLDFEIYSLNNEPIISTSTSDDFTVKETYNFMAFNDAIQKIKTHYNSKNKSNNGPLILLFRIKSRNSVIYNKMATTLFENFYIPNDYGNSRLLPYEYNYTFNTDTSVRLYTTELKVLKNKIIIAVYTEYDNFKFTELSQLTNIKVEKDTAKNPKAILYRYNDLVAKGKLNKQIINDSKSKFIFVLPESTNSDKNMDALLPFSNGCQCIAMKLQFYDNNLASYYNFFKSVNATNTVNGAYPLSPYAIKAPSKRKDTPPANHTSPGIELKEPSITAI